MGATMQWRQPPDREDRRRGDLVEFGRGRSRGRGYLAHSDRVGPGVLLLEAGGPPRADRLNAEGFTVLVPDVDMAAAEGDMLEAAALFLSANWHPRMAVVAVGAAGVAAAGLLLEREVPLDALVLYDAIPSALPQIPVLGHYSADTYLPQVQHFFESLLESGREIEVFVYDDERPDGSELAQARTVDSLEYYLS
jgi:hypothetical protein